MSHLYDLTMRSITGDEVSLSDYRGQVVLIVNVASL
jgi:glutathione peroxidase-family protein